MHRASKIALTERVVRLRAEASVEPVFLKAQILCACLSEAI
jgi:hypothetical protein